MKNLLLMSALLMTSPASAGIAWVQGPFWQTAHRTNYSTELKTTNIHIHDQCRSFERLFLGDETALLGRDASDFQFFSELALPEDMMNPSFYLEMKLDLPTTLLLEDLTTSELKEITDQRAKEDLIPLFTQNPTLVYLEPESFQSPLRTGYRAESLLAVGDKLGAKKSKMTFVRRSDGYHIALHGRDVACDLLAGRAVLTWAATVSVRISIDQQIALQNFYSAIDTMADKVFKKTVSPQKRAALLGFHIGDLVSKTAATSTIESGMLALLERLFDEKTMSPNTLWSDAFGDKVLSVLGKSENQKVSIEIKGPRHAIR